MRAKVIVPGSPWYGQVFDFKPVKSMDGYKWFETEIDGTVTLAREDHLEKVD